MGWQTKRNYKRSNSVVIPKRDESEIIGTQTKADYRIIRNWWSFGERRLAKIRERSKLDELLGQEGTVHVLSLNEISKAIEKDPKSRVVYRARKALGLGKEVEGDNGEWRFSRLQLLQLMIGANALTHFYVAESGNHPGLQISSCQQSFT